VEMKIDYKYFPSAADYVAARAVFPTQSAHLAAGTSVLGWGMFARAQKFHPKSAAITHHQNTRNTILRGTSMYSGAMANRA
jgi:hypothetical protein